MIDSLAERLQQNAARFPDKAALIIPGRRAAWETITYRQLAARGELFERGLAACGLQAGMRAVLMAPPSVDFFALVFALFRRGVVSVMIDPGIGLTNVTTCLARCQPEVYFGSALTHGLRRWFGWGRASLRQNLTLAEVARAGISAPPAPPISLNDGSVVAIIHTTGSTGLPKGVIYTAANFAAQVDMLVEALQLRGDEIDLPAFPIFALVDCLLGVTAVIPDLRFPRPAAVDAARLAAAIQAHQVNTMFASPAALARLARDGREKGLRLPGLQKVITAGAPAPPEVQEQFIEMLSPSANLFGIYGSTETLPVSLVNSREVLQETRDLSAQGAGVCIGRPTAGAQVQIVPISDEALSAAEAQPLPVGVVGEIAVQGAAVTELYVEEGALNLAPSKPQIGMLSLSKHGLSKHSSSKHSLSKHSLSGQAKILTADGEILHRMGDLGYFDEQGRLWYCGRKSQRVATAAGTLFTEQVEGIFNAHPLVYRTALVGVEIAGEVQPVLWVERNPAGRGADQNRLRAELLELAKAHPMTHSIQHILFHPAFPTDIRHNSKIIREKLAEQAKKRIP